MATWRAIVLAGNGINCEVETAHACRIAGADRVDVVMVWDLLEGRVRLGDYNFLLLPGGFLDGDDLGAAKAMAWRLKHARTPDGTSLFEQIERFVQGPNLVLGICNGFQLLVKLGLLPSPTGNQQVTVWANDSGRFEDRWVHLRVDPDSPCVFTKGLDRVELPVRHGEGKVLLADQASLVETRHLAPVFYVHPDTGEPTEEYPHNPNGSPGGVAGLCDETGRVFGLMPHPEAYNHVTNHPAWPRPEAPREAQGLAFFVNAVDWLRANGQ